MAQWRVVVTLAMSDLPDEPQRSSLLRELGERDVDLRLGEGRMIVGLTLDMNGQRTGPVHLADAGRAASYLVSHAVLTAGIAVNGEVGLSVETVDGGAPDSQS